MLFLPRHIIINSVLSYLDLYDLVRFSCSSAEYQKAVFEEIPKKRWNVINLSGNKTITDDQLRVFLTNINAKENTQKLSLVGCVNIRGPGLEPLRGSRVLEDIDLRVRGSLPLKGADGKLYGPSGLNEECVSSLLFSMLPLQTENAWARGSEVALRRVAIRPTYNMYCSFPRFYEYHHSLKPPGMNSCRLCFLQTDKSEETLRCSMCNKQYCIDCAMPPTCSKCTKQMCQWCSNVVECAGCNKRSCASHGYESCGGCENVFCQDCQDNALETCVVCNEYYCTEACHRRAHP